MTTAERSDILFYLIYAVAARRIGKRKITFDDIKSFNMESLCDREIDEVKMSVYKKYKELGGNGRVAKSSEFINSVDTVIGIKR